jgi:WD40 repeat protein
MRRKVKLLKYILIWGFICQLIFINGVNVFIINEWRVLGEENDINKKIQRYIAGSDVDSVSISSDGEHFVAKGNNMMYFFNKDNQTPLWNYTFGGSGNRIRSVSISSDGQYVVMGSDTGWTCFFDKDNSTPLWHYYKSSYEPYSVAISSDGQYIATGIGNGSGATGSIRYGEVCFFNKMNPTPLWNYPINDWVTSIAISSNGKYIVAGGGDKKVYFFENSSFTPIWSYETGDIVESVVISSDGRFIIAGSNNNKIYFFNSSSNIPLWEYSTGSAIYSLAISSDGRYIAVGGMWNGRVYLFNNTNNVPLWTYSKGELRKTIAMSSDGQYISVGHSEGKVSFFNIRSNNPLWTYPKGYMRTISSDGKYVVANADNIIYLIPYTYKPPPDYSFVWVIIIGVIALGIVVIFLYSLYYIINKHLLST